MPLYILPHLPFTVLFTPFVCLNFHLVTFFLWPEELLWVVLVKIWWWQIFLVFIIWQCLLSLSLEDMFSGYQILGWDLFVLQPFKEVIPFLMDSTFSAETSAILSTIVPLYIECGYSLAIFSVFSLISFSGVWLWSAQVYFSLYFPIYILLASLK